MGWSELRNKHTSLQREQDRLEIARRYLHGETQVTIARELSVERGYTISQPTISKALAKLREAWRQSAIDEIEIGQAKQLAKIDAVEVQAWAAWERSKGQIEETETERQANGETTKHCAKVKRQSRDGDPRWLSLIQSCIDQRCKILGLNAPQKYEHSGPGGAPIEIETDESIRDRIAGLVTRNAEAGDSPGSGN